MSMQQHLIGDIIDALQEWAPTAYAEDFDNTGLLAGDRSLACSGVLIAHDAVVTVIEQAIEQKCNLVVCFHPILFSGLKKLTGSTYVEKALLKAIQNDIAIYALHTALDNHPQGVNEASAAALGLQTTQKLIPQKDNLSQLVTYVPEADYAAVASALHAAGAGALGNYDTCHFSTPGTGQFRGNADSRPAIGQAEEISRVKEIRLETLVEKHAQKNILKTLFATHPYESVAYELIPINNTDPSRGMGLLGELPEAMAPTPFMEHCRSVFGTPVLRHSQLLDQKIRKVALLGGSGSFAIGAAKAAGADAFLTADLKYHNFFEAEGKILLVDIGHYESEQFTQKIIHAHLEEKFPNFANISQSSATNPVNYF